MWNSMLPSSLRHSFAVRGWATGEGSWSGVQRCPVTSRDYVFKAQNSGCRFKSVKCVYIDAIRRREVLKRK